jgi:hypothetical protein
MITVPLEPDFVVPDGRTVHGEEHTLKVQACLVEVLHVTQPVFSDGEIADEEFALRI